MNNRCTLRSNSVSSRYALAIGLVVLFATTAVFASTPQGTFDKTFQVTGPVDLEILTHSGDVTVRTGASSAVIIHGKIFVSNHWLGGSRQSDVNQITQNPPVRQDGNSIHIDYVNVREISVDYEITVPAETTVRTRTGSGDVILEGTRGNVDLQTGSGDVKLAHLTGEIRIQTGSGNVRAHEVAGSIKGGAGSGDIEIEETAAGDIELRTGSGNITVRGIQGGLRLEAGSGDIIAEGKQTGPWDVHTGSGNVHVRVPADSAFDADIATSSGTIDVSSPIEMTVQGRVQEERKNIRGKVRGGGPLLSVRTGSGDIHIQ
jgi:DUF4097 and DUF4098 domain-containing protein YvlB